MTFTVIGTAGELPKPPALPVKFLEDMDDAELANAVSASPRLCSGPIVNIPLVAQRTDWHGQVRAHTVLKIPRLTLYSLGNTCYMSATIQAMNAIPELQLALQAYVCKRATRTHTEERT